MNIKLYLKLMISMFTLTSYCCATLVDTIARNHDDRRNVYNGNLFADHKPINTYTHENNEILSDESKVDATRPALADEKRDIAIAVFGAAWTDLTLNAEGRLSPDAMIAERTHKHPYTVDSSKRVVVSNSALQNHFQILYWLDNLARDVVGQITAFPTAVINESLLNRFTDWEGLYAFDGFSKTTVAGWLNTVRTTHEPGLIARQAESAAFEIDYPRTIELHRNAVALGRENAQEELGIALAHYALEFIKESRVGGKNLPKAVELLREAVSLVPQDKEFKEQLAITLNNYSDYFIGEMSGGAKNFPKAIELLRESLSLGYELAGRNLVTALNAYAVDLMNGDRIERNPAEAINLLREAVALGYAPVESSNLDSPKENLAGALYNYAIDYMHGARGVSKDLSKVIELLREVVVLGYEPAGGNSVKRNLVVALNLLAADYFRGTNGFEKNRQKAVELMRESRSLDAKNIDVVRNLPIMLNELGADYYKGANGLEQNIDKAIGAFRESARLGNQDASTNLIGILSDLASDYYEGKNGARQNHLKALELWRESAALGDKDSKQELIILLNELAIMFVNGTGHMPKDASKAFELWRESIALGDAVSKRNLASALYKHALPFVQGDNQTNNSYEEGIRRIRESLSLHTDSARLQVLGDVLHNYGVDCTNGTRVIRKDLPKAISLLRESLSIGCRNARENLSIALYNYGVDRAEGTHRNIPDAINLLQESVALGLEPARAILAKVQAMAK